MSKYDTFSLFKYANDFKIKITTFSVESQTLSRLFFYKDDNKCARFLSLANVKFLSMIFFSFSIHCLTLTELLTKIL